MRKWELLWVFIGILFISLIYLVNAVSVDFIAPTPTENTTGNSIYVNLSTSNGGDHYSFIDFDRDLVLWMRMDDRNSSGGFIDLSFYGNNGISEGTAVANSTNGYFGNGSLFNAASKIVMGSSSSLNSPGVNDQITICAWINIRNHLTGFRGIVGKWKLNERQYLLVKDSTTNKYGLLLSNNGVSHASPNGAQVLSDFDLNTSQWYHLCGTYNGSNMYVYLDSQKQSGTADSLGILHNGSGNLEIGTFFNSFTYGFDGRIDEVLVFNRGLSQQEIKAIYNSSANRYENNFTNLANGTHNFTAYAANKSGDLASISKIIYTGANASSENDTVSPLIQYGLNTETSGTTITRSNIVVNATASDTNLANVTIYLYNSSISLINLTTTATSPNYMNFTNLSNGIYYFNATAYDISGNSNSTETRNVTLNYSASAEIIPALNLSFVAPTPAETVNGTSIYVNLSTNGTERYSFVNFDNDLILWMRMDDEDFGTIVDKSSYGNDGTFVNGSHTGSGIYGNALIVNGTNYLSIPNSSSLNSPGITDQVTICAWINIAQHGTTFKGIVGRYNTLSGNNDRQYLLSKNSADNKYGIFLSTDGTTYQANVLTNSALNTNQWYHLCGTSNGTVSLYLDGVKQSGTATLANIKDSVNTATLIGSFQRADPNFNGNIDEVLVFKRGLSEQEIKAIYNSSANRYENNFTGLSQGNHTFTGYVVNSSASYLSISRTISTGNTSSVNDTTPPGIQFGTGTETSGTTITRNNLVVNVTASDDNYANITIRLYNSTLALINSTYSTSTTCHANFTNLANGIYYFNATAYDISGNSNSTETRNVTLNYSAPAEIIPALNLSFVAPTPAENVNGTSIYVNLSTNGTERYSFVDFDTDLILWMRMDDRNASGGFIDLSSYGNNGISAGTVVVDSTNGYFGNGSRFNSASKIVASDSASLDSPGVNDKITICAWINILNHQTGWRGIVGKWKTDERQYLLAKNITSNHYGLVLSRDGLHPSTNGADLFTDSVLNLNQWYHLCGTYNGFNMYVYLNGVKQSGTANSQGIYDAGSADLEIGTFFNSFSYAFNGSIDEVLVFKRGLSEQEIKAIYNSSANRYENNFTGLSQGNHTFTGYVVNSSASYLSTSRTISSGNATANETNATSPPVITLLSATNYENIFNTEYELSVTNNPHTCVFSRDGANNITMAEIEQGIFESSESLTAGVYNLTFYCTNSNGTGSLTQTFTLRKSKIVHDTHYTNSEDLDIYFDFYFNSTTELGHLIIVPDSWSSSKDSYRTPVGNSFRDAGYSVVLVNTRGKGSSEGSRGAFLEECLDIYEVIEEVQTNPVYSGYIDDNVYIWGFSAGGGRAGACSARYPDLFSGIFSTGGVLNVTKWWYLNSGYRTDLEARIGGTPTTNPEGYTIRDASYLNYNALAPAMVTAYAADASVNVNLSRNYNLTMNLNGKEIRYDEYAGGSHAIVGLADSVLYFANHTEIYSIPLQGDFIIGSLIKTKNFSINLNSVNYRGWVSYNLANSTYQTFNITTLNYTANASLKLYSLKVNTNYSISLDDSILFYEMSDSEGDITKNISLSNYSSNFIIISEVTYPDIAAPVITPVYPASGSSLSAGTTETLINISTNESAECRYDLSNSSFDFANGTLFNITGNQSHSFILLGLSNGNTYTLYYKCNDSAGNINSASTTHTFSVSNPSSGGSSGGGGGGGGGGSSCTSNWSCTNWSACIKDSQERACIDLNKCGGNFGKPDTKQKCQSCIENWACTNWTECSYEGVQVRACTDGNLCGTSLSKPSEIQTCKKPDCNDKIQNQGEFGVDCGGPCAKRCEKIVAGGITGKMLVELEQPQENKSALKYSIFLIFLSLFVGVLIFVSRIETKIKEQKLAGHVNFKKMHFKLLLAHILHAIAIIAIFIIIILIIIF